MTEAEKLRAVQDAIDGKGLGWVEVANLVARAEERGRRAGIEERDLYRRLLLDFLCGHGPSECAGKGECFCDEVWPLFDIPHGRVDVARYRFKSLAPRDSGKEG